MASQQRNSYENGAKKMTDAFFLQKKKREET